VKESDDQIAEDIFAPSCLESQSHIGKNIIISCVIVKNFHYCTQLTHSVFPVKTAPYKHALGFIID